MRVHLSNIVIKHSRIEVLQWPSQSSDLYVIEMLWWDQKQKSGNLQDLKQERGSNREFVTFLST